MNSMSRYARDRSRCLRSSGEPDGTIHAVRHTLTLLFCFSSQYADINEASVRQSFGAIELTVYILSTWV